MTNGFQIYLKAYKISFTILLAWSLHFIGKKFKKKFQTEVNASCMKTKMRAEKEKRNNKTERIMYKATK